MTQKLGSKIDQLYQLREEYRALNRRIKEIKQAMSDLEDAIIADMDSMELKMTRVGRASATISEVTVPTVEDWDAAYQYILENEAPHLLERRVASTAWRELYEAGELVPGTKPFVRRTLSLRKA